jgi:hypothetical protein
MGQAKLRGTLEQRIEQGIAKREASESARRKEQAIAAQRRREEFAALPKAKQNRINESRQLIRMLPALAAVSLFR